MRPDTVSTSHLAVHATAQREVAADRFGADAVAVEGEHQVAADAVDARFGRRTGDGDVAADAVDRQFARRDAFDVDVGRHHVDVEVRAHRHRQAQVGRFALVAAAEHAHAAAVGVLHAHRQVLAVAFDLELLHALAEAAFDLHFGPVPGAHVDAALEVFDLDLSARIQRPGLVDRRGRQAECAVSTARPNARHWRWARVMECSPESWLRFGQVRGSGASVRAIRIRRRPGAVQVPGGVHRSGAVAPAAGANRGCAPARRRISAALRSSSSKAGCSSTGGRPAPTSRSAAWYWQGHALGFALDQRWPGAGRR